jgi:hypothetical protein
MPFPLIFDEGAGSFIQMSVTPQYREIEPGIESKILTDQHEPGATRHVQTGKAAIH